MVHSRLQQHGSMSRILAVWQQGKCDQFETPSKTISFCAEEWMADVQFSNLSLPIKKQHFLRHSHYWVTGSRKWSTSCEISVSALSTDWAVLQLSSPGRYSSLHLRRTTEAPRGSSVFQHTRFNKHKILCLKLKDQMVLVLPSGILNNSLTNAMQIMWCNDANKTFTVM